MSDKLSKLKKLAKELFKNDAECHIVRLEVTKDNRDYKHKLISSLNPPYNEEILAAQKFICEKIEPEQKIAYFRLTEDLSAGFAFTTDYFCWGDEAKRDFRVYKEINTDNLANIAFFFNRRGSFRLVDELCFNDLDRIKQFIDVAKNF